MASDIKPAPIVKASDMSPETKALPTQTHPVPKGVGEVDMGPVVKKAKGGKVRGHGIEKRGITKGKFI